jgi:hypothetical protein
MAVQEYPALRASRTSAKAVSSAQIGLAIVLLVLTFASPFALFEYHGYGIFWISFTDNTATSLLSAIIALSALALGYSGYMWGWRSSGRTAARFAIMTLVLGAWQWVLVLAVVLEMWARITSYATFAYQGYYWWAGTASYAVLVGAVSFSVIGLVAVWLTRSEPSPAAPSQAQLAPAAGLAYSGWVPCHKVPESGMPAWGTPQSLGPVVAMLPSGLPVQLVEMRGAWAHVVCSNGWAGWVDGRLLIRVLQQPPVPPRA